MEQAGMNAGVCVQECVCEGGGRREGEEYGRAGRKGGRELFVHQGAPAHGNHVLQLSPAVSTRRLPHKEDPSLKKAGHHVSED